MQMIPSLHQQLLEAVTVGICWVDAEGIITFANSKVAELLGCKGDALTSCRLDGVVQDAESIRGLLALTARGLPSHCKPMLSRTAGKERSLNLTAHPILDEQGNTTSTLVTFTPYDAVAGSQHAAAPAASEEHFRALFESIDDGVSILQILFDENDHAIDYRFLAVNRAYYALSGLGTEVVGKRMSEVKPDIDPSVMQRLGKVALTGESVSFEDYSRPFDRWYEIYLSRFGYPESRTVTTVFRDITHRKHRERLQAFLLALSDALRPLVDPQGIQVMAANLLGAHLQVNHALYGEVRDEYVHISHSFADGLPPMVGSFLAEDFGKRLMDGHRAGRLQVCVNTTTDPLFDEQERQMLAAAHVGAYIAVPLVKDGVWVAVLSVHNIQPRDWTPTEIELVQEVAERTWAAVERTRAEGALRKSEEKYRMLFDSIDEGVSTIEVLFDKQHKAIDFKVLEVNAAHEAMTGQGRDIVGKRGREFIGNLEQSMMERMGQVALTGQPIRFEEFVSGLGRWFDIYFARDGGSGSDRVITVYNNITERKQREANLRFLAEISADFAPLLETEAIMQSVGARLAQYMGLARCSFSVVDTNLDQIDCIYSWRRDEATPDLFGKHRISTFLNESGRQHYCAGQLSVIDDAQNNPLLDPLAYGVLDQLSVRSMVDVPYLKDGRWKFLLSVARSTAGKWHADEIELIRQLAERIYVRVERARAEAALRASEDRKAFLLSLSDSLRPLRDPLKVQRVAMVALGQHLRVNRALYFEVQSDGDTVRTGPAYLDGVAALPPLQRISDFGEVMAQYRSNESSVAHDVLADPSLGPAVTDRYAAINVRAGIGVPLLKEGQVVSVIGVHQAKPRTWTAADVTLIQSVAERTWEAVERARSEEALRESEARLQALMANLPGGAVFVLDKDLRYLIAEGEAITNAGNRSSDFLGKSIHQALSEDQAAEYEPYFRKALAGEHFELEHAADGRVYLTRGVPLHSSDEEVYAVLAASFDITERKRAEGESREADKRKDEFLAMLAHELRNPLAAISNATQVVKHLTRDNTAVQRPREVIERQLQHLTRLVDDLLDMSRLTWGKINLRQETLSLATVLQSAVEANRPLIDARAQQLTITLPPLAVQVVGDPTRLVQVFGNLLNNAAKYTEAGGHIALHTAIAAEEAIIRVSDNGCGLSESLLPHVFELFTQAGRSLDRSQGGLGIGLALVHSLVKMHGGEVEAHSAGLGLGSEFVVRLPLARRGDELETPAKEEATAQAPTIAGRLRVLVVEDNADAAEMLVMLLRHDGDDVRVALDGLTALDEARNFQPQVVLCDLGLPGLSGFKVASRLREQPECRGTLLVALSGYGREEDRRQSQLAGFDHHLTKPIDPEMLAALLQRRRLV